MSELQGLKKAELSEVAHRLGVHTLTKDTKKVLLEKLNDFIGQDPVANLSAVQEAIDAEAKHGKNDVVVKTMTISATTDEEEEDQEEKGQQEQQQQDVEDDEDDGEDGEEEDDDEEEEEEEDDAEEEEDYDEDEEDEDEDYDKDYESGPPIDLYTSIVDPIIKFSEETYSKILEYTDEIGITTVDVNGELRETLSKSITLSYAELGLEFIYWLITFVPLVELRNNSSIHPLLKDNMDFFNTSTLPTPDFYASLNYTALSTLFIWTLLSIVVPTVISYYINFTRRLITFDDDTQILARIYKYDPFIFALSKVLIVVFLGATTHHDLVVGPFWFSYFYNHGTALLDLYQKFTQILGPFPLILGLSNTAIALYSQFEEY